MLGKLIKYDLKSMFRSLTPLFIAFLIVGVLTGFILPSVNDNNPVFMQITTGLLILLLVGLTIAVYVMTMIIIIRRFYTNLLSDEGYLSFTLPVSHFAHFMSKSISAYIATIVSGLVGLVGYVLLFGVFGARSTGLPDLYELFEAVCRTLKQIPDIGVKYIVVFLLLILVGAFQKIVKLYFAMMIGNLSNDHKIFMSFVSWIGISVVESIISQIISYAIGFEESISNAIILGEASGPLTFFICTLIFEIGLSVIYTLSSYLLMKDKLNLA
ncbi:MAG: hypothetical protein K5851_01300 [Lachnospiraceae bacterium]|nr:hypothetical protein [Lachnospiraceae bacterium]